MAGIRSRELCQAPISASIIITLAGVVGKSLFLNFANAKVAAPRFERENAFVIKRALASVATAADSYL